MTDNEAIIKDDELIHILKNSRLTSEHFTESALCAAYVAALSALRERIERGDEQ